MSTPTFFHSNLQLGDTCVELVPSEAAHARNSRRLKLGHSITLLNGQGLIAQCTIGQIARDSLTASIHKIEQMPESNYKLIIACAAPKGDRQRTMVDMLTQLSVTEVIALNCDHSVTRVKDNTLKKWQRVAVEACKQSQNAWLPQITENLAIPEFLERLSSRPELATFYTDGAGQSMTALLDSKQAQQEIVVLIGPEGGFSPEEISLFRQKNFPALCLAGNILRTEAAAITVAAQFRGLYSSA